MEAVVDQPKVFVGPLEEEATLTAGLDHYKMTMSQVQFENHPDAEVTFTFKNRGETRLLDYIDPAVLQARFDLLRERSWTQRELAYFASLKTDDGDPLFTDDFLQYLSENKLPPVAVGYDAEKDDLAIEATGQWPLVTHWETIVMSVVNETYFSEYLRQHSLDTDALYEEGDRRLSEKIAILDKRPDIKFVDFGNRRHFSYRWQKHVDERLLAECPNNLLGTSNLALARTLGIKPSGTFAHEMPMVYAALADEAGRNPLLGHNEMLQTWFARYREEYSVALSDTFTSEFFFADFTPQQAKDWKALRHDSGDPVEFGNRVLEFYEQQGIDPLEKTIVFSDGLDIETIVKLADTFGGRINILFGWGTTLTNDLGLTPLNIVMKATMVNGVPTVKLSDNEGKHTGSEEKITEYKNNVVKLLEYKQAQTAPAAGAVAIGTA